MKKNLFLILTLLLVTNVDAKSSLPNLDCEVIQQAGNFDSVIPPGRTQTINIDLNNPQDIIKDELLFFSGGGYIPMGDFPVFKIQKISSGENDNGGLLLVSALGNRTVKIQILGKLTSQKLNAWLINEETHDDSGLTVGIISFKCVPR